MKHAGASGVRRTTLESHRFARPREAPHACSTVLGCFQKTERASARVKCSPPRQRGKPNALDIIGELCSFLEFTRIVTALSLKPVILAGPVQAWQAARASEVGCRSGWRRSGEVVGNLQPAHDAELDTTTGRGQHAKGTARGAVQSQQVSGYPDRLVFCLSEKAT
jgi:hypothetical protein